MKQINLIRETGNGTYLDCYDEFQDALKSIKQFDKIEIIYSRRKMLNRVLLKIMFRFPLLKRMVNVKARSISLSLLMGGGFETLIPEILRHENNYIYMFDAWPRFHQQIDHEAKVLNVKSIFFSSKQITNLFKLRHSVINAYWVPEGINLTDYMPGEIADKTIDVLEFGRKYQEYHLKIRDGLKLNGYNHFYEKTAGDVIFKSRKDFVNALALAKICICVPSNISHPQRAEGISSLTLRYLQSMASKCLIVGVLADEMVDLFDYNPVVSIEMDRAGEQILEILRNYHTYLPLIERNYLEVSNKHTWDCRFQMMTDIIQNEH